MQYDSIELVSNIILFESTYHKQAIFCYEKLVQCYCHCTFIDGIPRDYHVASHFLSFGKDLREKFVQERFAERSVSLHAPICFKFVTDQYTQIQSKKKSKTLPSDETENSRAVKFIQYATSRGKTIDYVLQFPILPRPIFLLEKDKLLLK